MINALVRMYLASDVRLASLEKTVNFVAMPRAGEFIRFNNKKMGDYFDFAVDDVTHVEDEDPEITLELWRDENGYNLLEDETELDEYVESYEAEGWNLLSIEENTLYKNDSDSADQGDKV